MHLESKGRMYGIGRETTSFFTSKNVEAPEVSLYQLKFFVINRDKM